MNATKICRRCGEDCAARPRIKDPRGRYYCTECYEHARHARRPAPTPAPANRISALLDEVGGIAPCSSCARPLAASDIVCPGCGLNRHTGQHAHTHVEVAPRGPDPRTSLPIWPWAIGGASLVIGGVQAGGYLLSGIAAIASPGPASDLLWELLVSSVFFLIALQLILGGVNILRKRQIGVAQACLWARIQLVLCLLGALALGLAFMIMRSGSEFDAVMLAGFVGIGVAAIWPIFILAWFGRAAIQEQIHHDWT